MWTPIQFIRRGAAGASHAEVTRPASSAPRSLLSSSSPTPPRWTQQFVGKQMVYFDDQFPNWNGVFADAAGVIGGRDFPSLDAARAAVADVRRRVPNTPNGVVYLQSDEGKFAAYELNKPVQETRGFIHLRKVPATEVLGRDQRVRLVEDGAGRVIRLRGVAVGTIIV